MGHTGILPGHQGESDKGVVTNYGEGGGGGGLQNGRGGGGLQNGRGGGM